MKEVIIINPFKDIKKVDLKKYIVEKTTIDKIKEGDYNELRDIRPTTTQNNEQTKQRDVI